MQGITRQGNVISIDFDIWQTQEQFAKRWVRILFGRGGGLPYVWDTPPPSLRIKKSQGI